MKINRFLSKQSIKTQFFLVLFSIFFFLCTLFIFIGQYLFSCFNDEIHKRSKDVISIISKVAEDKMKDIEAVSLSLMTNSSFQQDVQQYFSRDVFERVESNANMKTLFSSLIDSNTCIDSIVIYKDKQMINTGFTNYNIEEIELINNMIDQSDTKFAWVTMKNRDNFIYIVRDIVKIQDNDWSKMGLLFMSIALDEVILDKVDFSEGLGNILIVNDKNEKIYATNGWDIKSVGVATNKPILVHGEKYIVSYVHSPKTNWRYYNMVSYNNMADGISNAKLYVASMFVVGIIFILLLSIQFSFVILLPIKELEMKLKNINSSGFAFENHSLYDADTKNEIIFFHKNFYDAITKIDKLIHEKYEVKLDLKANQLKMLQMQINPHFLYNTLETIKWLTVAHRKEDVCIIVKSLSNLLRKAVDDTLDCICLKTEIELVKDYLDIHKIRNQDKLSYEIQIDETLYEIKIPKLTLQPIVENSIKYIMIRNDKRCVIEIKAHMQNDNLVVYVSDNGTGVPDDLMERIDSGEINSSGTGIGLKNIDKRFKALYGQEYGISIVRYKNKGCVGVILPISF